MSMVESGLDFSVDRTYTVARRRERSGDFLVCVCVFHTFFVCFVEVSPRDYRAWYGLGQTYELLKMPYYSLYYFKEAQKLR